MRYHAKPGSPYSDDDAEVIGPVLRELAEDGHSEAVSIVKAAEPEDSPLHPYFTWDDQEAARRYRKSEARKMARSIEVSISTGSGEERVRAFHLVRRSDDDTETEGREPGQYRTVEQVESDPDACQQVVEDARRQLLSWLRRFQQYRELFGAFDDEFSEVFDAIEGVEKERAA